MLQKPNVIATSMPVKPAKPSLWFAVAAFGSAFVLLALIAGSFKTQPHILGLGFELAAGGLGFWLALIILLWARRQGRLDPFELPTFISLNVYGQMILPTWLLNRNSITPIPWLQSDPGRKMTMAILLIGFGLTCMWAGYIWTSLRMSRTGTARPSGFGTFRTLPTLALWFVTWTLSFLSIVAGAQGWAGQLQGFVWGNYLSFIDMVAWTASIALAFHVFRNPSARGWIWLVVMVLTRVYATLLNGSRGAVLVLLGILMIYYYARHRISIRWLVIAVFALIFLSAAGSTIRENLSQRDSGIGVGFIERIEVVVESLLQVADRSMESLVGQTTELMVQRQSSLLDITASVMYIHTQNQIYVGSEFLEYLAVQMVPRIIWREKPTSIALYDISGLYYGFQTRGLSAIGLFGDSFRIGGWIASTLILGLLGVISAWLYQRGPGIDNFAMIALYLTVATRIITYDTNLASLTLNLIQMGVLIWLLLKYFIFAPSARVKRQPPQNNFS